MIHDRYCINLPGWCRVTWKTFQAILKHQLTFSNSEYCHKQAVNSLGALSFKILSTGSVHIFLRVTTFFQQRKSY